MKKTPIMLSALLFTAPVTGAVQMIPAMAQTLDAAVPASVQVDGRVIDIDPVEVTMVTAGDGYIAVIRTEDALRDKDVDTASLPAQLVTYVSDPDSPVMFNADQDVKPDRKFNVTIKAAKDEKTWTDTDTGAYKVNADWILVSGYDFLKEFQEAYPDMGYDIDPEEVYVAVDKDTDGSIEIPAISGIMLVAPATPEEGSEFSSDEENRTGVGIYVVDQGNTIRVDSVKLVLPGEYTPTESIVKVPEGKELVGFKLTDTAGGTVYKVGEPVPVNGPDLYLYAVYKDEGAEDPTNEVRYDDLKQVVWLDDANGVVNLEQDAAGSLTQTTLGAALKDGKKMSKEVADKYKSELMAAGFTEKMIADYTADLGTSTEVTAVLKFDANGGEGVPADITVTGTAYPLEAQIPADTMAPTRKDYKFKGWALDKNATTAAYSAGDKVKLDKETTTLYAVWSNGSEDTKKTAGSETAADSQVGMWAGIAAVAAVVVAGIAWFMHKDKKKA